ncbi:MAG: N-6 DNA methylase [Planctomycetaceae bacterium]|nr:N-6 DNA methylase [Planctomycetaceae bacterium]
MLDTATKRRIDTARDILVGKVPDPKSQVEQITIALIYKFMDDMDAEAEELGGKRKFFAGDYARYGWAKLMRSGLGGHETLSLYAEAIAKMPENPGIPPLFRDIFKNAYLPYRDPETLRAFLKIIHEFEYDHSERLGDAFEYLLSVLGSQGDAGQFRTPRHIIDFIVAIVDPKKTEAVLDPACGTAGFLISSYKHILKANTDQEGNSTLTPDERGRLATNFKGYDISPDMVRLSLVNLYLHGFTDPHIFEYDTLTSQDRWNEYADVILANPPFMSPKGGIKPHNRFSVQSKRSEVLFVDYMAEHLSPNGRAGIIVPEGIIFQSQTAYTQLRKMLVEEYLVAVVSLPAGVFNPYSGVKTSILILDRSLAKQTQTIAFFKIENDGFGLGAQRREIEKNDLPQARVEIAEYLRRLRARESVEAFQPTLGLVVPKEKIAANGDYNLSGERYREGVVGQTRIPMVPLGEVAELIRGITFGKSDQLQRATEDSLLVATTKAAQSSGIVEQDLYHVPRSVLKDDAKLLRAGDILISTANSLNLLGRTTHVQKVDRPTSFGAFMSLIRANERILDRYLIHCLRTPYAADFFLRNANTTTNISNLNLSALAAFEVPLPPLDVQKEIVAEIEGYQKVIDGARAVLDNYRPHIPIHPDWPLGSLGEHFVTASGGTPSKAEPTFWVGDIPWVSPKDMKSDVIEDTEDHISEAAVASSATKLVPAGSVVCVVRSGILKHSFPVALLARDMCINQDLIAFRPTSEKILSKFLFYVLKTKSPSILQEGIKPGVTVQSFYNGFFKDFPIPVPTLETQEGIVAEIETEQALVAANRELITRFERKIQATLARVWGEEAEPTQAEEA